MFDKILKKRNIFVFVILLLFKLILDIVYVGFINEHYYDKGFILDFNPEKYVFSIAMFVVLFLILPKDNEKPSSIFMQLHFIVMILPMFTIYAFMNKPTSYFAVTLFMFLMECLLLKWAVKIKPIDIKLLRFRHSWVLFYGILIGITVYVYAAMISANGIPSLKALNLYQVYEIRSKITYPFLMGYLLGWQAKVINPFLITISYLNNNRKLLVFSVLLQILLFFIAPHKAFLFIPIAIIIVVKFVNQFDFLKIASIASLLCSILLFASYKILGILLLPSLFLRRFFYIPALIKFDYYDFFSRHNLLYFSQGILGKILGIDYPYEMKAANIIGDVYFHSSQTAANGGYLADAYANMGYLGMFLIAILFVIILILIDSLSYKAGKELTVGLSVFLILSLNDGALLTTLLTGGMLFLLFLLYMYSSTRDSNVIKVKSKALNINS